MKKRTTFSLITIAILGLTGCGGGGGDSSIPASSNTNTGIVGDGYIEGAYVCHDSNNNLNCLDETYATTAADGSFNLSSYDSTQDLLVQIPVGAVDNGPFVNGSTAPRPFTNQTWYYYPAGAAPANGPIFVGPLSTLVFAQVEKVPGISVTIAVNTVANTLGLESSTLLGNYIENNSTEGNTSNFVAELVGSTLSNSSSTVSNYGTNIQNVLANGATIGNTASSNDPITYNTSGYNATQGNTSTANGTTVSTALIYTPVTDICNDLQTGTYFAFEDWDSSVGNATPDRSHKTLYLKTDASTGDDLLQIRRERENGNAWSINQHGSSTEFDYLQNIDGQIIDMTLVNATVPHIKPTYDVIFPAIKTACNGSTALFNASGMTYRLYVSESDLNGLSGANLPQGPSVSSILNNVTFGAGDKIYQASVSLENDVYIVNKGQNYQNGTTYPGSVTDYRVYTTSFTAMPNSMSIDTFVQTVNNALVLEYRDNANYSKFTITSAPASNHTGTINYDKVENGATISSALTYEMQTYNGEKFLVIKNYKHVGLDYFIGKINAIDTTNLVYGEIFHAGGIFDLSQGGFHDGDIMDDIMLNASARDRVLTNFNTQTNSSVPTPALP